MANLNFPTGFMPVRYLNGTPWEGRGNGRSNLYWVPSTDTDTYAPGDPVASTPGADASGVPQAAVAVAGSASRGVVVATGIDPFAVATLLIPMSIERLNLSDRAVVPAVKAKAYYIEVVDDPQVVFEVQEGGTGVSLTAAAVNLNCNFVAAANDGFVSQYTLDNASTGTSSSLNLKILGLSRRDGNGYGQYAKWLVLLNSHELI